VVDERCERLPHARECTRYRDLVRSATATCATLAFAILVACSSGDKPAGTFAVQTTARPAPRSSNVTTVAPSRLHLPSPARLFAGTSSAPGQLTHYCKNTLCTEQVPRVPTFVAASPGDFSEFTVGQAPLEAVADIRTRTGE